MNAEYPLQLSHTVIQVSFFSCSSRKILTCFRPMVFFFFFYNLRIYRSCKQNMQSLSVCLSLLEKIFHGKKDNFVFIMVELGPYEVLVQLTNDVTQLSAISSTNQLV